MTAHMSQGAVVCRVDQLRPGQRVDLEGDPIADVMYDAATCESPHPEFQFEFEVVTAVDLETPGCILVTFESGFACGFPPDHEVDVDGEQVL